MDCAVRSTCADTTRGISSSWIRKHHRDFDQEAVIEVERNEDGSKMKILWGLSIRGRRWTSAKAILGDRGLVECLHTVREMHNRSFVRLAQHGSQQEHEGVVVKKIQSLFMRNYDGDRLVHDEIIEGSG